MSQRFETGQALGGRERVLPAELLTDLVGGSSTCRFRSKGARDVPLSAIRIPLTSESHEG
ncbi:hypothetical protein AB0H42_03725 [Nocardia sp. NPDC050799]|uniref:hypothetical protein n=1 Tax=Nocardia sp. NPDC050799 TaxID=3154842 RepID=UPI0033F54C57